mmetsp:Transcript_16173/g.18669  ORF Transcript_16173/g.18669 Transcript_16173/m.18669 type:complete len:154 (-) Transcript_16173:242-703(-)|eukprot:CAMPEP_0170764330 /NCGR_PEP_ID=MMETSP0733-20121128/3945_1 /TAXON_ID=186038 /ORGANISM="Fragilariopsis kerguelensis, Strain L26-C5" /LENGTH=153 /DNA_ID=CAMNT_0011104969 /DNA_START=70 /DNA_END=531 /DNA_ORIENTATION=-
MMIRMKRNLLFSLLVVAVIAVASVSGFAGCLPTQSNVRSSSRTGSSSSTTAIYGIFDSMKKSMESGYAGGEDSPYARKLAQDAEKAEAQKQRSKDRRKKGYKELKDVIGKEKTFVNTKYDNDGKLRKTKAKGNKKGEELPPPKEEKKKLFGMF